MSARKMRNSWWVDFRHEGVRVRMRSPDNTRAGASAYEHVLRERLARGEPLTRGAVPTFGDFAWRWHETYAKTNNKPSEIHNKESMLRVHLVPAFGGKRLDEIAVRDIEAFKCTKLKSGLSPKTVNNNLIVLRKCLLTAVEWGELKEAPKVLVLKAPSARLDYLSDAEVEQLLADHAEPFWNSMLLVALHTGMRQGELLGLEWDAVDLEHGVLNVCRSNYRGHITAPKNNRARSIPMSEPVQAALRSLGPGKGPVFAHPNGVKPDYSVAARSLARVCRRSGTRTVSWHVLRHTFATQLVERGVNIRAVQTLLGHSSIAMTERYAHVAPTALRGAIDTLTPRRLHVAGPAFETLGQQVGNNCTYPQFFSAS